jgi:L-2-amino-thiazoline-4-carboxylic acid hydrolase
LKSYRKYFYRAIDLAYPDTAVFIKQATESHYTFISKDVAFAKRSPNPIDRRLDFCAYFLSLIKVLEERGETYEAIRKICLDITIEMVRPKHKLSAFSKKIFPLLTNTWLGKLMIKKLQRKAILNPHPLGFKAEIIMDPNETFGLGYGIDILECGICKLFQQYEMGRYAKILCEVDEITSAQAGLQLVRTGTIANGAVKCDFRYRKRPRLA